MAPLLPPLGAGSGVSLMSDHLASGAGGGAGRSGVAWPSATIPARVKKLSWDDAAPTDNKVAFDPGLLQSHFGHPQTYRFYRNLLYRIVSYPPPTPGGPRTTIR